MGVILILLLLLIPVVVRLSKGGSRRATRAPQVGLHLPYQKRRTFFTANERRFYVALSQAVSQVDRSLVIFSKVRMADLVSITTVGRARQQAWWRISQKHCDFLLLRPSGEPGALEPALVIEVDDASHERPDRRQRDAFVDAVYDQAGLPILHVPVVQHFAPNELAGQIRRSLGLPAPSSLGLPIRSK